MIVVYVAIIAVLILGGVVYYLAMYAVQTTQEGVNSMLGSDKFATEENWNSFNLANTFINNLWLFFLVVMILGMAYYGYTEAQRRGRQY